MKSFGNLMIFNLLCNNFNVINYRQESIFCAHVRRHFHCSQRRISVNDSPVFSRSVIRISSVDFGIDKQIGPQLLYTINFLELSFVSRAELKAHRQRHLLILRNVNETQSTIRPRNPSGASFEKFFEFVTSGSWFIYGRPKKMTENKSMLRMF